ncbi:porin [Pasteurellaceae bacterium RH1A]|nr:porin [Pasteurellaceae bacterium RH1A]
MKKTLVALALVAATSAQAYTFDIEETGTKIDFSGSVRLKWESTSNKTTNLQNGNVTRRHVNEAVDNNGSRFGFRITQNLANDFYALGRVEWRFRGKDNRGVDARSQHNFDHLYTHQLFAGIGHKQYGELTYGNMTVITDEVKQTDLPNTYSLSDGLLEFAARRAVQYVYRGVEGLKVGGYYAGASKRGDNGLDLSNKRKDVWGLAAIYNWKLDDLQRIKLASGISRERFEQPNSTYSITAYGLGTAYTFDKTTLGLDLERRVTKDQGAVGNKRTEHEVRTVVYQKLTKDWNAYTMYAYKVNKFDGVTADDTKRTRHQFMLGTEYFVYNRGSLKLKPFVEWQATRTKDETNGVKTSKSRDYKTLVGLRAYW